MKTYLLVLIGLLSLSACGTQSTTSYDERIRVRTMSSVVEVDVEVADTSEERAKGLMGRTSLPDRTGMLFVFDGDEPLSFWMKNTLIPLDILFFRADGSFVSGATMVPCDADPCPIYSSAEPASMALEVPAGFSALYSVGEGWSLERGQ